MTSTASRILHYCLHDDGTPDWPNLRRAFAKVPEEQVAIAVEELRSAQLLVVDKHGVSVTAEATFTIGADVPQFARLPHNVPKAASSLEEAWRVVLSGSLFDELAEHVESPIAYSSAIVLDTVPDLLAPGDDQWSCWSDIQSRLSMAYTGALVRHFGLTLRDAHDFGARAASEGGRRGMRGWLSDAVSSDVFIIVANRMLGGAPGTFAEALFDVYRHGYWPCGVTQRYPIRAPLLAMPMAMFK